MYSNETYHSNILTALTGPHDISDIYKVMDSKVKVTNNTFQTCTSLREAYQSIVWYRRPSSCTRYLLDLLVCSLNLADCWLIHNSC